MPSPEWLRLKRYTVTNAGGALKSLECQILVRVEIGTILWKFGTERSKSLLPVEFNITKDEFYSLKKINQDTKGNQDRIIHTSQRQYLYYK